MFVKSSKEVGCKKEPVYGSTCNNKNDGENEKTGKQKRESWLFGFAFSFLPLIIIGFVKTFPKDDFSFAKLWSYFVSVFGSVEVIFISVSQATTLLIDKDKSRSMWWMLLIVAGSMVYITSSLGHWTNSYLWVFNLIYSFIVVLAGMLSYGEKKQKKAN